MRLLLSLCSSLVLGLATAQFERRYAAVPIAPDGLMPRYFFDKSNPVVKRDTTCPSNQHSCLDVGFGDQCCDDDTYCYLNQSGALKCCPFGSLCDNPCSSRSYLCTRTTTASGTPSAQVGCCGPQCPSSNYYLCASSLGGNCCENGATCASGDCIAAKTSATSNTLTPAGGCTTSQYRCADGSGCCDNTQLCTEVGSTGFCVSGSPSETVSVIPAPSSKELSDGAKAGIGVGVVVGAAAVISFLAWLCMSKRRQQQRTSSRQSGIEGSRTGGHESTAGAGGVDTMTEASGTEHSRVRQGLTQDYFGPNAVAGPFTDTSPVDATSPRAVPTRPDGPGDITAAVEIDSRTRQPSTGYLSPITNSSVEPTPLSENIDGRFELYGSDGLEPLSIVPTPQESPYGKSTRPAE